MARSTTEYICQECGYSSPKWLGSCPSCSEWDTFQERQKEVSKPTARHKVEASVSGEKATPLRLDEVEVSDSDRMPTGIREFDRVLGGGLVKGSFLLLGGDPGIGKSTLMLQLAKVQPGWTILYVAGEESPAQIKHRAERLGVTDSSLLVYAESDVQRVVEEAKRLKPDLVVIDSIQTLYSSNLSSLPGSVQQIRECSAILQKLAKRDHITTLLIGHVTKDGDIAGPKILEHTVDTVLYFEGDTGQFYRILRTVKNRFGAAQEVGVFEMNETGLHEVANPSILFTSGADAGVSGTCLTCIMEGSRALLVEVQALVTPAAYGTPQRTANGFDQKRLSLLLAVLEKRAGVPLNGQDVYLNIVGGLKIHDPAADLAVLTALTSSYRENPVPERTVIFGEVGLGGEVRKLPFVNQRLLEAEKMGLHTVWMPEAAKVQSSLTMRTMNHVRELARELA
ncbi:MAG: DNA repair protein RadA [Balneolaceae bacterium]